MKLVRAIFILTVAIAIALGEAPRGSLAQVSTPTATPSPTPAPTPTPVVVPTRRFICNCFSGGQPVAWSGIVTALSYTSARQAAAGKCLAYLGIKPISPLIPAPGSGFARSQPTPLPPPISPCSLCACN